MEAGCSCGIGLVYTHHIRTLSPDTGRLATRATLSMCKYEKTKKAKAVVKCRIQGLRHHLNAKACRLPNDYSL